MSLLKSALATCVQEEEGRQRQGNLLKSWRNTRQSASTNTWTLVEINLIHGTSRNQLFNFSQTIY